MSNQNGLTPREEQAINTMGFSPAGWFLDVCADLAEKGPVRAEDFPKVINNILQNDIAFSEVVLSKIESLLTQHNHDIEFMEEC